MNQFIILQKQFSKFNLRKFFTSSKIEVVSYGKQEGFAGVECNSNGLWEDADGTLWFGTVSGLVKHEPFNLKQNKIQNSTLIENVKIFVYSSMSSKYIKKKAKR